jgi:hypothetical protein
MTYYVLVRWRNGEEPRSALHNTVRSVVALRSPGWHSPRSRILASVGGETTKEGGQRPAATSTQSLAQRGGRRPLSQEDNVKELRDAFEKVFRDLAAHGCIEDDEHLLESMWWQFVSDMQRNVYPAKATQ